MAFSPRIKSEVLCGICLCFQPLLETFSNFFTRFQLHWLSFPVPVYSKLFSTCAASRSFFFLPGMVFTALSVWLVILSLHVSSLEGTPSRNSALFSISSDAYTSTLSLSLSCHLNGHVTCLSSAQACALPEGRNYLCSTQHPAYNRHFLSPND